MDEDSKALVEAAASAALRPLTDLIDNVIGVLGGDALAGFRERRREKRRTRHAQLSQDTTNILRSRGMNKPVEPNATPVAEQGWLDYAEEKRKESEAKGYIDCGGVTRSITQETMDLLRRR